MVSSFQTSPRFLLLRAIRRKLASYPTKTNPRAPRAKVTVKIRLPFVVKTRFVTIDDVDQFKKAKTIRKIPNTLIPNRLPEQKVKVGILRLLQELKIPKDWGGESNDIFSVKLKIRGRLKRAAFALKGPAKKGTLVPGMMGKNGDQIQRLFNSPAEAFFVQYEDEIGESVVGLMEQLARAKSVLNGSVFFGTIDRDATYRLRLAYPKAFSS